MPFACVESILVLLFIASSDDISDPDLTIRLLPDLTGLVPLLPPPLHPGTLSTSKKGVQQKKTFLHSRKR